MELIAVGQAKPGELPLAKNTIYKFHSTKRHPEVIFKVSGKLFFDMAAWRRLVEESRQREIDEAERLRKVSI
ncbi:MAG: hypothetical protein QTN59_10935 [Candidatus Electrothrix communis]|nr:MAG: hypothetical protein QTN59_10935 [Candidatus Electrothrix communis]